MLKWGWDTKKTELVNLTRFGCGSNQTQGSVFVFDLLCITLCKLMFCNQLEKEEKAGCSAFIVLQMSSNCK